MYCRNRKSWVVRHGHAPKRARNAEEKAIETRSRQEALRAVADGLLDRRLEELEDRHLREDWDDLSRARDYSDPAEDV